MVERVHTFRSKDGRATAASGLKDGANLPGGADAWIHQAALDPADLAGSACVTGVGNAAEILAIIEQGGFFFSPHGRRATATVGGS